MIDQIIVHRIGRRPSNVNGERGKLVAQKPEILHAKMPNALVKLRATDLKYEMFNYKGERVDPNSVDRWYEAIPASDTET
jgi:hypothetical protein